MQVCNELNIDGVAYLSKRILDFYAYPQAVNLAIAMPYNEKYLYWQRANEIYKGDNHNNKIILAGIIEDYTVTKHSEFDEYLLEQKFYNFSEICNTIFR